MSAVRLPPQGDENAVPTAAKLIYHSGGIRLYHANAMDWLAVQPARSIHGVVTDPPYGLREYDADQVAMRSRGKGGIWRIPPAFDGAVRAPLPRFTVLTAAELAAHGDFFRRWAAHLFPVLVPGAYVVVASNPLLMARMSMAIVEAGFEPRGQIVRLVSTLRGGDRPKGAELEFVDVSVMARSAHEPWVIFRKPLEGTAAANLRKWDTGALRRPRSDMPFADVIKCPPPTAIERRLSTHPSLKPQRLMRQLVRAVLPRGTGIVLDTFAGSGSTLAAAAALGYCAVGVELNSDYTAAAAKSIPLLTEFTPPTERDARPAAKR